MLQWMTAKEQLSELELDLRDKNKETLDLKQELDELKAKELQNENVNLEEEACSLFDKVSSNFYFQMHIDNTISISECEYFVIVDDY